MRLPITAARLTASLPSSAMRCEETPGNELASSASGEVLLLSRATMKSTNSSKIVAAFGSP